MRKKFHRSSSIRYTNHYGLIYSSADRKERHDTPKYGMRDPSTYVLVYLCVHSILYNAWPLASCPHEPRLQIDPMEVICASTIKYIHSTLRKKDLANWILGMDHTDVGSKI